MDNVPEVKHAIEKKQCCIGTVDTWLLWVRRALQTAWTVIIIRQPKVYACDHEFFVAEFNWWQGWWFIYY
jgi:hypothetical protein